MQPIIKEAQRIRALEEYDVLDTLPERAFDDITYLASYICGTPVALITLVDEERQWFKSKIGFNLAETARDISFCAHAIDQTDLFVIKDATKDERFKDNPLVTSDPHIRFYAGVPLVTTDGHALGTLCVIDRRSRELRPEQIEALRTLSRQVMVQLEVQRIAQQLVRTNNELESEVFLRRKAEDALREKTGTAIREMQNRVIHNGKIADLGRVAAQVAHEVRNPLGGLLLYSMHLKNKVSGKLSGGELNILENIIDTINRLKTITEQIMDYARPVNLNLQWLDLNSVINGILQLLEPKISANKVETVIELDPECISCPFDEALLYSALTNLTLNAIEAMPEGGTLKLRTKKRDGLVRITIIDSGSGMTQEQVNKTYEPFYSTKAKGLGLGMSGALKIIEHHKGNIRIDSNIGEGTQIIVELPIDNKEGKSYESES
jgi:signal transduction histidine kinase